MLVHLMYRLAPAIMSALFPGLSRVYLASRQRFSTLVSQIFKLLFVGTFPIALTTITFTDIVILLIFGQEYTSSIPVLRIHALGIVPSFVNRFLFRTVLASDNERLAIRVSFVNIATNVVLNLVLIPSYGTLGASIAAVCTILVGLAQNLFYLSHRVIQFDFRRALLMPGLCVLVSLLVHFSTMRWNSLAAWILSTGTFIGMLLGSRTITRQDLVTLSIVRPRT
jgi:O-antigen/teichoic acid export membrane protein